MNAPTYIIPRILNPMPLTAFADACAIIGVAPSHAISDPTWCLRVAGSVPADVGQAFAARICAPGTAPDLSRMSADESALTVALLWIRAVDTIRHHRARQSSTAALQAAA